MNGTGEEIKPFGEILDMMRGRGEDGRTDAPLWRRYADMLEAAYKRDMREMKEIANNALDCLFKLNQLIQSGKPKKEGGPK